MKNMKLVLMTLVVLCMATSMFAAEAEVAGGGVKWGALSAALVLGVAAAAGAIRLAMIIGLALIESLVIYALVIAFMIHKF